MTPLTPQDPSAPRAAAPAIARPRPRVRRRRRVLLGAALLAAAVLLLPFLLRGAARALVVSEAAPESSVLIPWRVPRAADGPAGCTLQVLDPPVVLAPDSRPSTRHPAARGDYTFSGTTYGAR